MHLCFYGSYPMLTLLGILAFRPVIFVNSYDNRPAERGGGEGAAKFQLSIDGAISRNNIALGL